jgi:hypothetical protein
MDQSKMKESPSFLKETLDQSTEALYTQLKIIEKEINSLPPPQIYELNKRSILQISAAVAVDAGQSLFGGVLREMGIMLLQVASSEDMAPKSYTFGINPILKDDEKKQMVKERLERLKNEDKMVEDFVNDMGWDEIAKEGVMPSECYNQINAFGNFIRELLEWAKLRETAIGLKEIYQKLPNIQPILLRDGPLSFFNIKEHALGLSKIFGKIGIPLLGLSKTSTLLRNPLIIMWLKYHKVFNKKGPFMIKLPAEKFKELGYSLSRYFGAYGEDPHMKFGTYVIVRFDPLPGSKNIFAVDIPHYYFNSDSSLENLLVILSGVAEHSTATSYPVPGYPYALKKAHEKVVFTKDKIYLLENTLRRNLPPDVYNMLKSLEI